jgi:23S rRNA (guanine745-N1)-methyltransferase
MVEPIWKCPVCETGLMRAPGRFACAAGHSFDIAREGYVNLVLAHQRRSPQSGDPKESLRQRRVFLEAGHYAPLATALVNALRAWLPGSLLPGSLLDVGCGEGWYLRQLAASPHLQGASLYGVDVAREAVRLAARAAPSIEYAVGNTFRLPVLPASVDAVVQVFAPSAPEQVRLALRQGGILVEVTPGPGHLRAYRELIYETPREHAPTPVPPGFEPLEEERVSFDLSLSGAPQVAALVEMTPYRWHMDPQTYARVQELTAWDDTADFRVAVYRPKEGTA